MKLSLDTRRIDKTNEAYNFNRVRRHVELNQNFCFKRLGLNLNNPNAILFRPDSYTFDGALWVSRDVFYKSAPDFFRRSRRSLDYGSRVVLRGTRYTISSNPTFEVRQKLDCLVEDFEEGLDALLTEADKVFALAISDHIKNVAITLLNGLISGEKIGRFRFNNQNYQRLRRDGQKLSQQCCELFYGIMVADGDIFNSAYSAIIRDGVQTVKQIVDRILQEYKDGTFSSRHISRPEAAHPLIIGGFAVRLALDKKLVPDTILGMPAGATELALATTSAFKYMRKIDAQVVLLPASLHSVKHDFDDAIGQPEHIDTLVEHYRGKLRSKRVLVVDDNSSTGRTIDIVSSKVSLMKPKSVRSFVAEADIVRTQLRLLEGSLEAVASPSTYTMCMNVLPISRMVSPKFDLKQLNERRRMVACVRKRFSSASENPIDRIMGNLYVDLLKHPEGRVEGNSHISSFRHTFLSNFARVDVSLERTKYSSVEHAYQRAKLTEDALEHLTEEHIRIINKKLARRGTQIEKQHVLSFFSNPEQDAGTSKTVGNQLRILGFVRPDWDDVKLPLMTALLVQKFADEKMYKLLEGTKNRKLVEGNDWGDTYWGVCDGRGRNVLGRVIMQLRSFEHAKLVEFATDIRTHGIPNYSS